MTTTPAMSDDEDWNALGLYIEKHGNRFSQEFEAGFMAGYEFRADERTRSKEAVEGDVKSKVMKWLFANAESLTDHEAFAVSALTRAEKRNLSQKTDELLALIALHQPADAQGLVRELRSIIRRLYRLSDVLLSAEEGETMEKANTFLGEKS